MNGKYTPPPAYPVLGDYIVIEPFAALTDYSASSGSYYEETPTVAKKTGYELIGISGFNCKASETSGSNPDRMSFFRMAYEIGEGSTDTIKIGFRANAAGKVDVTVDLMYFKTT